MIIEELKKSYQEAKELSSQLNFIEKLLENNDKDVIEYHYSLLKYKETDFFYMLRAKFKKRGNIGSIFLLEKLQKEKNIALKAEALFILGLLRKNLNFKEIKILKFNASQFILKKENYVTQYYGIIVLGWIGEEEEVKILENELSNNLDVILRSHASSALRQIWFNHEILKEKILRIYFNSLKNEDNSIVNSTSISCIQDLLQKKFGINEVNGKISGNVEKAKIKVLNIFEKDFTK